MQPDHSERLIRIVYQSLDQAPSAYSWLSIHGYSETAAQEQAETRKALRRYLSEPPATLKANAELLRDELAAYAAQYLTNASTRLELAKLAINEIDRRELVNVITIGELHQRTIY